MRSIKSILIKYFMLLIATLLVLIGITEYFQYKSYLKYFQNNAIEKSEILASNLQATLLFESKKDFEDLTKNHKANGIIVVDTKKKLFAARGEFFDFQKINSDITWSDHYLITRTKIYSESEELGTLFVRYETSRIYTLVQAQLLYITLGVAALIISILVVLKIIDVQLTTPLKELSDFAKKLTQNDDISSRLQITERNLETKSLKDSFNCLLDNIEDNNKSLNDLNTNLEKKVSEKTIELQEAFDDLKKFQNQIVAQEKLASLGSLAAGIAHILIKDNGIGMSKETLTRILEPFYTTKPAGAGTGLGMSMVNDIITAHKGEMSLESSEGLFTKVKITLPLS